MCWSGEASVVLSVIGIGCTLHLVHKKEHYALFLCLGYFSLMEALQAYTYRVIGQCTDPSNQIATLLGYLHITFQPFFINAISLYFINQERAKKVAPWAYAFCFLAAIMMLIKLYPFDWAGNCKPGRMMCSDMLCSTRGSWHMAWHVPINTISDHVHWYLLASFLVPLLYGSWRFTLYQAIVGPGLAYATTQNMNERPAVWCLFSLGILLVVMHTPIRKLLYTDTERRGIQV